MTLLNLWRRSNSAFVRAWRLELFLLPAFCLEGFLFLEMTRRSENKFALSPVLDLCELFLFKCGLLAWMGSMMELSWRRGLLLGFFPLPVLVLVLIGLDFVAASWVRCCCCWWLTSFWFNVLCLDWKNAHLCKSFAEWLLFGRPLEKQLMHWSGRFLLVVRGHSPGLWVSTHWTHLKRKAQVRAVCAKRWHRWHWMTTDFFIFSILIRKPFIEKILSSILKSAFVASEKR